MTVKVKYSPSVLNDHPRHRDDQEQRPGDVVGVEVGLHLSSKAVI
jgi:hypothetical protein